MAIDRLATCRPRFQEPPERWIELDGLVRDGRAEHHVREPRADQASDNITGWLSSRAQSGTAAMGELHGVLAWDVEAAMVLANQPRGKRQMQSGPPTNRVRRLASRQELRN